MTLGGLQKNSFIDYPGRICAVLFTKGCNFACPYCHNPELLSSQGRSTAVDEALSFLKMRKGMIEAVTISGGEPTLQEDLGDFCAKVKEMGYPVKLDTNGSRPEALAGLLDAGLVDYVAMDIKTDPDDYSRVRTQNVAPGNIRESIRILLSSGVPCEFRTTCVRPLVSGAVVKKIAAAIEGASLYALQRFHDDTVLDPDFFRDGFSPFSEAELSRFAEAAAPYVGACIIR